MSSDAADSASLDKRALLSTANQACSTRPIAKRRGGLDITRRPNRATPDALTLLLYNQNALCAAIEEVTKWLSENGVEIVAANMAAAMETLDRNVQDITDAIMQIRQL